MEKVLSEFKDTQAQVKLKIPNGGEQLIVVKGKVSGFFNTETKTVELQIEGENGVAINLIFEK